MESGFPEWSLNLQYSPLTNLLLGETINCLLGICNNRLDARGLPINQTNRLNSETKGDVDCFLGKTCMVEGQSLLGLRFLREGRRRL